MLRIEPSKAKPLDLTAGSVAELVRKLGNGQQSTEQKYEEKKSYPHNYHYPQAHSNRQKDTHLLEVYFLSYCGRVARSVPYAKELMMSQDVVWRPQVPLNEIHRPRPGRKLPPWPEGEDYFAMLEKHGVPNGPFDKERKLDYRG